MSISVGFVVSQKLATMHDLDTVYGVEDMYDLLEIAIVDNYNKAISQNGNR